MLDWCPVCENLIPPGRQVVSVQAPIQAADKATSQPVVAKTALPKTSASTTKLAGKKPTSRRGGRGQSAAALRKPGVRGLPPPNPDPDPTPSEDADNEESTGTDTTAAFVPPTVSKKRTIISQDPTPLYCSDKCMLADQARTNAVEQLWGMANDGELSPRFDPFTMPPPPIPLSRPGYVQTTSMHSPPNAVNADTDLPSSAPAAILRDVADMPRDLPLDRWRTPSIIQPDANSALQKVNSQQAVNLYSSGYPLAYAANRPVIYSRRSAHYEPEDETPSQSLVIPRNGKGRMDDSLEIRRTASSRKSDSGSSERSGSTTSRKRRPRSRNRAEPEDQRPISARSRSSRSGLSTGSGGSPHAPSSFKQVANSREHFRSVRMSSHPLSSSFSAKDAEEEQAKAAAEITSQSVPSDPVTHRSSWWGGSVPRTPDAESTTTTARTSPKAFNRTFANATPISTSSSSATIAALPSALSAFSLSSSKLRQPPATSSSPPKRNSSLANLAGAAASFFGLGMGITPVKPPPEPTVEEEPVRGRSRASSKSSTGRNLVISTGVVPASTSIAEVTQSDANQHSTRLPLSMSMDNFPVARKPLGPMPKELEEKLPPVVKKEEIERRRESKSPLSPTPKSAWDPELVRGIKESRRLSREASYFARPTTLYANDSINPFHTSPPQSPQSPASPHASTIQRSPNSQRRRTTSQTQLKSHSRSNSHSNALPEGQTTEGLPRVLSNNSISSMTTAASGHRSHHKHREPPSPTGTGYTIAGPSTGRALPRGLSMTSLSQQAFGGQPKNPMYGGNGTNAGTSNLNRTNSQPYVARWFSTSPSAGSSAFGTPSGTGNGNSAYYANVPPPAGYNFPGTVAYGVMGPGPQVNPIQPSDPKSATPTYPLLALPNGTRKKKVWTKQTLPDGREEDILVDGDEEEAVYDKRKKLFYVDR